MGDFLYYQKGKFIYEYNYITGEITSTIECRTSDLTFAVSPNRKYILADDWSTSESIILYTIDSEEIKTYSWSQLADDFNNAQFVSMADNGIAVFGNIL
jgi:hypothetical protein